MAKHILYNSSLSVNSVDLSDHVESISYEDGIEGQRADAMSETQKYEMAGLIVISDISVTFYQDYASGKVYQTIHPLLAARSSFNIIVKADSGSAASTNPQFTISVFVRRFGVIGGSHGDRHMTQAVFAPAGVQSISAP